MDSFLQEKRKGKQYFRDGISQHIAKSQYFVEHCTFTHQLLQETLKGGICEELFSNNKINLQSLNEIMGKDLHVHISKEDLKSIFGQKKQISTQQLFHILKCYDLLEFDYLEELQRHIFEDGALSIKKVDQLIKEQGFAPLNSKNKQLLIDSFDVNEDQKVTQSDIKLLFERVQKIRVKTNNNQQAQ